MGNAEGRVLCRTPTPGKRPTRIARWKYGLIRTAILKAIPADERGVEFRRLPELVRAGLSARDRERLGSVAWYTTTVKLELEVAGEIERVEGSRPQRLRRRRKAL